VKPWSGSDRDLALACLAGQREALIALDALIDSVVPALASRGANASDVDDVLQLTRARLLVTDGDQQAGLTRYSGAGRLGGFVRTVAMRIWLNLVRDRRAFEPLPAQLEVLAGSTDPELERMRSVYLHEFAQALARAWSAIAAEQRVLLRHQLVDRLNVDELSSLYGIHRATAARRLIAAKEALVVATREILRATLGLSEHEISSVLRLIETQLDVAAVLEAAE
jgi:RNA polymerase sigma-70 factor, ECF subfamily